jgi:phosphoribosyl 1,2-cyclic phosphate phosphodiesterase
LTDSPTPRPRPGAAAALPARVTFLGTGTSHGVPMIGCRCSTCRSSDPRDRRLRPSIYVDVPGRGSLLVDSSTDLRQQALAFDVTRVDAVLYTHAHADHILGLDELRRFNVLQGSSIPCYADARTWEALTRTFFYVFDGIARDGGGVPQLEPRQIDGAAPFVAAGVRVQPVPLLHGRLPILGFRFGSFAYLTDCSEVPDQSWPLLENLDTLVVDALRYKPHPTHFSVDEALAVVSRLGPRRAYFTHMAHDLPHADTCARLPGGVELAYDGLRLDIDVDAAV